MCEEALPRGTYLLPPSEEEPLIEPFSTATDDEVDIATFVQRWRDSASEGAVREEVGQWGSLSLVRLLR